MKIKLMLDSGAFSAYTRGVSIDIKKYGRFLERNAEHIAHAVNLDVIPGRKGQAPSTKQVNEAAEQGWVNYQYLRKIDPNVMPVYHYGENIDWLRRMVDHGAPIIGLGGIARQRYDVRQRWLDQVFGFLQQQPPVKVHGFGMTSVELMHAYPWYSVDSVTWTKMSAYGWLLIPGAMFPNGKFNFRVNCYQVGIAHDAKRSPDVSRSVVTGHFLAMGRDAKDYVEAYLNSEKLDRDPLHHDQMARLQANARFFKRSAEAWEGPQRLIRSADLFNSTFGGRPWKPEPELKIIFGTAPRSKANEVLNNEKAKWRLVSYFQVKQEKLKNLREFVMTGGPVSKPTEIIP